MKIFKGIFITLILFSFSNLFAQVVDDNVIRLNLSNIEEDESSELDDIKLQLRNMTSIEDKLQDIIEESRVIISITEMDIDIVNSMNLFELLNERRLILDFNHLFKNLYVSFDGAINNSRWDNYTASLTMSDRNSLRNTAREYSNAEIGVKRLEPVLEKINELIDQKLSL